MLYILCSGAAHLQWKSIWFYVTDSEDRTVSRSVMIPPRRQKWMSDFSSSSGWIPLQPAVDKCWPTSAAKTTTLLHVSHSWKAERGLEIEKEVMGYKRHLPWTYSDIFPLAKRDGGRGGSRRLWKMRNSGMAFSGQVLLLFQHLKGL